MPGSWANNYGTDQEKRFIKYLHDHADSLKERYNDFYLLRNEKTVKLFNFKNGEGFEPDFSLFLRKKDEDTGSIFQVFIEPKGKHIIPNDEWKETFLEEIEGRGRFEPLFQGNEYRIYGLPFFNEEGQTLTKFNEAFQRFVADE